MSEILDAIDPDLVAAVMGAPAQKLVAVDGKPYMLTLDSFGFPVHDTSWLAYQRAMEDSLLEGRRPEEHQDSIVLQNIEVPPGE